MSHNIIAKERMWLTVDRRRLVTEGDSRAATLYAAVGTTIPGSAVKMFGITGDGYLSRASKARMKAEDKARVKDEDKDAKSKPGLTVVQSSKRIGKRPVAKAK